MPATNFPGGASSYGIPLFGQGSMYDMPCDDVWFVGNSLPSQCGDGTMRTRPFASLADALARADQDDTIFILAGHAENITASNVFSGTASTGPNTGAQVVPVNCRIVGEGIGTQRPAFTFTAAASTLALASANSTVENCQLLCPQTGTTTAAALVTVTAAGCMVRACRFQGSASATALCTTGISLSSAASDFQALENTGFTVTGTPTSWLSTTGTVAPARVAIQRNIIRWLLSAIGSGIVDVSAASGTAPVDLIITDNCMTNLTASATVVIKGVASAAGLVAYNVFGIGVATNGTTTCINTPGSLESYQNFVTSPGKWAIVGGGTGAQTS